MEIHLNVLIPPKGVKCMCKTCRVPFAEGVAVVEVFLDHVPHLLKANPPPVCQGCKEVKNTCMVFLSAAAAWAETRRLMPRLEAEGPDFLELVLSSDLGLGGNPQN
ncbi:hypothetical protein EPO17_01035 [Patescibacteria group bacterium]|nr:MAG: hypothetical protein EPO17_01035 [Patescibacteria group bacterium]